MTKIIRPDFDATLRDLTQNLVDQLLGMGFPADAVAMYKRVWPKENHSRAQTHSFVYHSAFYSIHKAENSIVVGQSSILRKPSKPTP